MPSSTQFYAVTLTNSISNPSPNDGFVDPNPIQRYYSYNPYNATNYYSVNASAYAFETTPASLTLNLCLAKRRANHRWNEIIRQLELVSNVDILPYTITVTGGSAPGWTPTSMGFQMAVPFGDSSFGTVDETASGYLYGIPAITRCIARALISDQFREMDVFDPTATTSPGNNTANVVRYGVRINPAASLEVGAYAANIAAANACIAVSYLP